MQRKKEAPSVGVSVGVSATKRRRSSGRREAVARTTTWAGTRPQASPRLTYAKTSETEHQITGLDPETPYQVFVVSARNGEITGTYTIRVFTLASGESKDSEVKVTLPTTMEVSVRVSQSSDYGAATGQLTLTIPPTGSFTLPVGANDDEADGSVTATVDTGSGYTVPSSQGAGDVLVFRIVLSRASDEEFEVSWTTARISSAISARPDDAVRAGNNDSDGGGLAGG